MTDSMKVDLKDYLDLGRNALLWKLDGLSEYDMRRPMTPTGTNLLGLVKHMTGVELGYFGWTFDRTPEFEVPWATVDGDPNSDMWATADESPDYILGLYRRTTSFADTTIDELPLDAPGVVPHWPEERAHVTLGRIIVHVTSDLVRHAGHADIIRELIDGAVGLREDRDNIPPGDEQYWADHRRTLEEVARGARG